MAATIGYSYWYRRRLNAATSADDNLNHSPFTIRPSILKPSMPIHLDTRRIVGPDRMYEVGGVR
jgi:hypothetical protein